MTISFEIPGKPCAWQRARSNGKVRFDSPEQSRNKLTVATIGSNAMRGKPPLECPLYVRIAATWPWPKSMSLKKRAEHKGFYTSRPDADNIAKLIGDALNNIVWRDDSQIIALDVIKRYGETPKTLVIVEEMP